MTRYRNTRTGAVRESSRHLGFPFVAEETASGSLSSLRKAELVERAAALNLETEGKTVDELRESISAAETA